MPIRVATRADWAPLYALEQRCFDGDRLSARQFRYHLRSPKACFLLSENPALSGYALVLLRPALSQARLYSICVDASARGLGVGRSLSEAAIKQSRAADMRRLTLEVRLDNTQALALYRKLGFERCAELKNYYQDGADGVRMELLL